MSTLPTPRKMTGKEAAAREDMIESADALSAIFAKEAMKIHSTSPVVMMAALNVAIAAGREAYSSAPHYWGDLMDVMYFHVKKLVSESEAQAN